MTEKEILDLQEQRGNQEFFLIQVGSFLHAYGSGAFALSRVTGYRVMRKTRKQLGEVLTTGFPVARLDSVREKIFEAGGMIEHLEGKTWLFRGLDGTVDLALVSHPQPKPQPAAPQPQAAAGADWWWLANEVSRFNLSQSTPMDAMNFIAKLQQHIKNCIAEKVQGADCPQGKAQGIACESPSGQGSWSGKISGRGFALGLEAPF